MKNMVLIIGLCVVAMGCGSSSAPKSGSGAMLDEAISGAAGTITAKLTGGGKIAVVNFASASEGLSEYVIEELSSGLANGQGMVVVDRKSLELIREELQFQLSGEVSDESAQRIGQMLGAEYIATGSLSDVGNSYRFRVKVLTVETAALVTSPSSDVSKKDERLAFLMKDAPKGKAKSGGETYKIGDVGPAGGLVFYDKGVFSNGWRYLEAAPPELEFTAKWDIRNYYNMKAITGTGLAVGTGKTNTQLIIKELGKKGEAATKCAALKFEDYKDWFLPSKDELDLMYKNLKSKGLGGFSDNSYWSSSEHNDIYTWHQRFSDGSQDYNYGKRATFVVHAIRAF